MGAKKSKFLENFHGNLQHLQKMPLFFDKFLFIPKKLSRQYNPGADLTVLANSEISHSQNLLC